MGIFQKIKMMVNIRKSAKNVKEAYVKSGWKTSEFWLVVLSNAMTLVEAFKGTIDPKTAAIIVTSLTAVFNIVRGLVKATAVSEAPPATPPAA